MIVEEEGRMTPEAGCYAIAFEDGRGPPAKERRWLLEVGKARKWIYPYSLQKEPTLLTPCLQSSETDFALDFQNCKTMYLHWFKL